MPAYKNQFSRPTYYDHDILDENGGKIGTLRVKPTGVLWQPKGAKGPKKFYSIALSQFAKWITSDEAGARRTKS